MTLIVLKCPSCGADIELDESREFAFCSFCGTKVMQDKKIVELKGKIKIDGISTYDKLLERAFILIEDQEYAEAEKYLKKVLEFEPKCSKAYWGLMLCEFRIPNVQTAETTGIDITESNNYKRAISFAQSEEKEKYKEHGKTAKQKFDEKTQILIRKQTINNIIFDISKIFFAFYPIVAYLVAVFQNGPNKPLAVILSFISILWFVSYILCKKYSQTKKKNNKTIWLIIGGLFLVLSIFISCSERVPAGEVVTPTTTVISELYSK